MTCNTRRIIVEVQLVGPRSRVTCAECGKLVLLASLRLCARSLTEVDASLSFGDKAYGSDEVQMRRDLGSDDYCWGQRDALIDLSAAAFLQAPIEESTNRGSMSDDEGED